MQKLDVEMRRNEQNDLRIAALEERITALNIRLGYEPDRRDDPPGVA